MIYTLKILLQLNNVKYFKKIENSKNINEWLVSLFGSVIAVAFQNIFPAEMHQNDVFLKKKFEISASKQSKTYKKN